MPAFMEERRCLVPRHVAPALAALAAASALAVEPVFHEKLDASWAVLSKVEKPRYPDDAIDNRVVGVVELTAVIQPSRLLKDVVYTPDRPESAVFVDALKRVVSGWELNPPLGLDCQPASERVRVRVAFELEGVDPKVTVMGEKGRHSPYASRTLRPLTRVNPRFPRDAIRRGWEANVYSLLEVDADGNVERVSATAYPRYSEPEEELNAYTKQVEAALRKWKFAPAATGEESPRKACWDVNFRLN